MASGPKGAAPHLSPGPETPGSEIGGSEKLGGNRIPESGCTRLRGDSFPDTAVGFVYWISAKKGWPAGAEVSVAICAQRGRFRADRRIYDIPKNSGNPEIQILVFCRQFVCGGPYDSAGPRFSTPPSAGFLAVSAKNGAREAG